MTSKTSAVALEAKAVSHRFGSKPVLNCINLSLRPGELTALIGPNGAGKSTLLQVLQGMLKPSEGFVMAGETPIALCRHRIALMPQRGRIDWSFPITALDMVRLRTPKQRESCFHLSSEEALERVGLLDRSQERLGHLSGGQQQRVLLAAAIAQNAPALLLDEPCSALDPPSRERVIALLQSLARDGRSICLTSHDWGPALMSYDRVIVLDREVLFDGSPQDVGQQLNELMSAAGRCPN